MRHLSDYAYNVSVELRCSVLEHLSAFSIHICRPYTYRSCQSACPRYRLVLYCGQCEPMLKCRLSHCQRLRNSRAHSNLSCSCVSYINRQRTALVLYSAYVEVLTRYRSCGPRYEYAHIQKQKFRQKLRSRRQPCYLIRQRICLGGHVTHPLIVRHLPPQ